MKKNLRVIGKQGTKIIKNFLGKEIANSIINIKLREVFIIKHIVPNIAMNSLNINESIERKRD